MNPLHRNGPISDPTQTTGGASIASTDDLPEGVVNLYFTNERVDDRVASLLIGGTGIDLTYDDPANGLTITVDLSELDTSSLPEGSNLYFTNERVDDRVAALLVAGTNVTLTYDDVAGTLTVDAASGSVGDFQTRAKVVPTADTWTVDDGYVLECLFDLIIDGEVDMGAGGELRISNG